MSCCFECSDYPCKRIKNLEKSYNKKMERQKNLYTCPIFGGKHCPGCGGCEGKQTWDTDFRALSALARNVLGSWKE